MGMFTRRDVFVNEAAPGQIETCLYKTFTTAVCQMGLFTRRNMCVYTQKCLYTYKADAGQIEI